MATWDQLTHQTVAEPAEDSIRREPQSGYRRQGETRPQSVLARVFSWCARVRIRVSCHVAVSNGDRPRQATVVSSEFRATGWNERGQLLIHRRNPRPSIALQGEHALRYVSPTNYLMNLKARSCHFFSSAQHVVRACASRNALDIRLVCKPFGLQLNRSISSQFREYLKLWPGAIAYELYHRLRKR